MASRRVRIKGIANIPQRRKLGNDPADADRNISEDKLQGEEPNLKEIAAHIEKNQTETEKSEKCEEIHELKNQTVFKKSADIAEPTENLLTKDSTQNDVTKSKVDENSSKIITIESEGENNDTAEKAATINVENINKTNQPVVASLDTPRPTLPIRRRFLKPTISSNLINNRKSKEKPEEAKIEQDKENVKESVNINLNETTISTSSTNVSPLIQKIDSASLSPIVSKAAPPHLMKYTKEASTKSGSDTEYPPPPPSPNKLLNRARIKAVPRLDQRRTSFSIGSASESEDDTRRSYTRIRNDSVCSAASAVNEPSNTNVEAASPVRKEIISVIQRKCKRTEQSRKLAEARREFYTKFHNGTPDKQKLTMIDLIFYNPSSNPMTQKKKRKLSEMKDESENNASNEHIASKLKKMEEERIDDPLAVSDDDEDDEDLPAPQIKIGLNGEIVVDEKSLVIENSSTKKSREALENSEIVDGDFDTNYGVYKRVKRSKDWSKEETLRFYKALNTIGTDFTMMCELFPKRTRRELKMKFKKEERLNRNLVDKAVMRPVEFDLTELRRDLEIEERREEEMKRRKKQKEEIKEKYKTKRKKSGIKGIDGNDGQETVPIQTKQLPKREKKPVKSSYNVLRKGINSILENSEDEDDLPRTNNKTSDSNEEASGEDDPLFTPVASRKKSTRITKPKIRRRRKFKIEFTQTKKNLEEENTDKEKQNCAAEISLPNNGNDTSNQNLEPGSIMIVSSKTPDGEMVYKVFMVTDQQNKEPINLNPDMLQNLTQNFENRSINSNLSMQNILTISAHKPPEYNVTIAEDQLLNNGNNNNRSDETTAEVVTKVSSTENIPVERTLLPEKCPDLTGDSIIFPFDDYVTSAAKQNITISHDDSKLVIVTEQGNN